MIIYSATRSIPCPKEIVRDFQETCLFEKKRVMLCTVNVVIGADI